MQVSFTAGTLVWALKSCFFNKYAGSISKGEFFSYRFENGKLVLKLRTDSC